ncbi:MAG: ROK family protein [Clostridia bacterium]|nr:ROK family protein [Clostridia bacterium]
MKKFINQDDMKNVNFIDVFNLIKELKQTTRKQIEAITKMSWGAVSNITARLIEKGLVIESKAEKSNSPGRTPSYLEVNGGTHYAIGIDVNMTGIKAELVNIKNDSIKTWKTASNYSDKTTLLECITGFIHNVLDEIKDESIQIIGIGIAMQGIVDADNGISVNFPACKGWENVPLADIIQTEFGIPVWIEHDPNCILLAHSENSTFSDAILLRIDRGIGMSLMIDGNVIGGMGMFEIGQTIVNGGTLEDHSSITGMETLYGKPFDYLVADANNGISYATDIFNEMASYLATSIYNIRKIFNVSTVILCGDVMSHSHLFLGKIKSFNPDIDFSEIDVSCASYGAAIIAVDKSIRLI